MQNSLHQKEKSLRDIFDDFFLKVPLHLKSRTLIFSWKGKPLVLEWAEIGLNLAFLCDE